MISPVESEYGQFKQAVSSLVPLRLDLYKQQQMERRIRDLARKHQAPNLLAFSRMLQNDAALLREFEQHLTINVSEFYRNPEAFQYLTQRVLPLLLDGSRSLQVWSAGCSYGAEPFTLAMVLKELAPRQSHTIHATDIDRAVLAKAKLGKGFSNEDIKSLPADLRRRYIVGNAPPYAVADDILRMVRFSFQDLLQDKPTQTFDLIACRNVVIYFTDEAKLVLYEKFAAALRPGGYLFIGATEVINAAHQVGLQYIAPCFYRKAA